jgi:transcriptional regulator ATRX
MIKNRRADITQALKQVRTQRRIALTGSPLQNNLMEYYCVRSRASLLFCLLNHPVTEITLMFNTSSLPTYFVLSCEQMVDFVREGFLGSTHEFRNR